MDQERIFRLLITGVVWAIGWMIVRPESISVWGILVFSVIWVVIEIVMYGLE